MHVPLCVNLGSMYNVKKKKNNIFYNVPNKPVYVQMCTTDVHIVKSTSLKRLVR